MSTHVPPSEGGVDAGVPPVRPVVLRRTWVAGTALAVLSVAYTLFLVLEMALASFPVRVRLLGPFWLTQDPPWVRATPVVILLGLWAAGGLWLRAARTNAVALAPGSVRGGPGRAWWCWLPLAHYWFLPRLVDDVLRATGNSPSDRRLTRVWWVMWVLAGVTEVVARRHPLYEVDASRHVVEVGAYALALVAWLLVIRRVTLAQEVLAGTVVEVPAAVDEIWATRRRVLGREQ